LDNWRLVKKVKPLAVFEVGTRKAIQVGETQQQVIENTKLLQAVAVLPCGHNRPLKNWK